MLSASAPGQEDGRDLLCDTLGPAVIGVGRGGVAEVQVDRHSS